VRFAKKAAFSRYSASKLTGEKRLLNSVVVFAVVFSGARIGGSLSRIRSGECLAITNRAYFLEALFWQT
jgi:hypothetical protein